MGRGLDNSAIAKELEVTYHDVIFHITNLKKKLVVSPSSRQSHGRMKIFGTILNLDRVTPNTYC
jgi:DNA-binding NarL/FixJ family response regulator